MDFVNQHITSATGIYRGLRRVRIAGNDDAAVGRVEPIAVTLHGVLRCERRHRDVLILVDDAGGDLMGVYFVAVRERSLIAIGVGTVSMSTR